MSDELPQFDSQQPAERYSRHTWIRGNSEVERCVRCGGHAVTFSRASSAVSEGETIEGEYKEV